LLTTIKGMMTVPGFFLFYGIGFIGLARENLPGYSLIYHSEFRGEGFRHRNLSHWKVFSQSSIIFAAFSEALFLGSAVVNRRGKLVADAYGKGLRS
jgi:hypothetical protein